MEAEILEWHVRPGDAVRSGQPLVSVETDKAVVDIPSPRTATVTALHGAPGDVVEIGAPLVDFEVAGTDTGAVVGSLEAAQAAGEGRRPAEPTPAGPPAEAAPPPGAPPAGAPAAAGPGRDSQTGEAARARATPRARRRARELGVELDALAAAGAVIRAAEVEAAAAGARPPARQTETLRGVRRAMARRMADAHERVVAASVTEEADITAWSAGQKPMLRLIRAVVRGCGTVPVVNARFDDAAPSLTLQDQVNLGIAMETEDGLFVPVIREAEVLSASELTSALEALERQVRLRTVSPETLRGATITLSNFGVVAGLHAEMVVVPPQVAIVGAGRIFGRLALRQGVPGTARILPLSLTFDHRALTGVEACRFLAAMVQDLETPG